MNCHTILPRFAQEATAFNGAPSSGGILGALIGLSLGRNGRKSEHPYFCGTLS